MKSIKYSRIVFRQVLVLFFLSSLTFGACKKFLEAKTDDKLVVPSTIGDLQSLLDNTLIMNTKTPSLHETASDDFYVQETYLNGRPEMERLLYTWRPFESQWQNDWSRAYNAIYISNFCLEGIDKVTKTEKNWQIWDNVKGAALFFRSYHQLQLAWVYAKAFDKLTASEDLGIALRYESDFNIPSQRATVEQTYQSIIKDAKESINYLPISTSSMLKPNKAAAYGLLARSYLSMRDYDSAGKYAALSLDLKSDLIDYKSEINASTANPFARFNKETIFYTEMIPGQGIIGRTRAFVDTTLLKMYSSNDRRVHAYFQVSGVNKVFKGDYTGSALKFSGIAVDEMILIRAEFYARKGEINQSLADLNWLLSHRYDNSFLPLTIDNTEELIKKIVEERRKELLFRGLRWMDIKRLNKEGFAIIPKRKIFGQSWEILPNSNYYALPLPQDVVNIAGFKQN